MTSTAIRIEFGWRCAREGVRLVGIGARAALPGRLVSLVAGDRRVVRVARGEDGGLLARLFASPSSQTPLMEARLEAGVAGSGSEDRSIMAAARSRPVIVEAPPSKILTQTVRVPAAALENLTEAVKFGLPTWTPFAAEEVVFHADVVDKGEDHARIRIQMVTRADLAPLLDLATLAGFKPSAVGFGADAVSFSESGDAVARGLRRADRVDLVLAVTAILVGAGLLVALHVGWSRELDDLQADIKAEIAQRAKQTKLEAELNQLESRQRAVLAKRAADPRVSALIADLADRLPETAEVREFEWNGKRGRLRLTAAQDIDLAAALGASTLVTAKRERGDRDGVEAYELTIKAAQ